MKIENVHIHDIQPFSLASAYRSINGHLYTISFLLNGWCEVHTDFYLYGTEYALATIESEHSGYYKLTEECVMTAENLALLEKELYTIIRKSEEK